MDEPQPRMDSNNRRRLSEVDSSILQSKGTVDEGEMDSNRGRRLSEVEGNEESPMATEEGGNTVFFMTFLLFF